MRKIGDTIWGNVLEVVDGDTFDMEVTHIGDTNQYSYNQHERIRIEEIDAPELPTRAGRRAQRTLEGAILGRSVRCDIRARDRYRRLICAVTIS